MRAERAMVDGIDWIGGVVEREAIACGWVKSGAYRVATSALNSTGCGQGSRRVVREVSARRTFGSSPPPRSRARCGSRACSAAPIRRTARGSTRRAWCEDWPTRARRAASRSSSAHRRASFEPGTDRRPGRDAPRSRRRPGDRGVHDRAPRRAPHVPPTRLAHARDGAAPGGHGRRSVGRAARRLPTSATSSPTCSGLPTGGSRSEDAGSATTSAAQSANATRCSRGSTPGSSRHYASFSPPSCRCADHAPLGRLLRGPARLVDERLVRPRDRHRACRRLFGPRGRRLQPRRTDVGRR